MPSNNRHVKVAREEGSSGTNLGIHVANGSHTSARETLDTRAEVFNDGAGSTLDGEDASKSEDDIRMEPIETNDFRESSRQSLQ